MQSDSPFSLLRGIPRTFEQMMIALVEEAEAIGRCEQRINENIS